MNPSPSEGSLWLVARTLWYREMLRFMRQRSRIIGAVATPLIFWIVIGSGMGRSFRPVGAAEGVTYLEYALPGSLVLIVLFTSIFSTISTIEDRREGFLQSVLVAPASGASIALGKILGAASLGVMQALVFVVLLPLVGVPLTLLSAAATLASLATVSFGLAAMGFVLAWRMQSTQGFHAVMNLLLMPMWLLSGAFFPPSGASTWMSWIIQVNPLTYGVALVRHSIYLSGSDPVGLLPSATVCLLVTGIFAGSMFVVATAMTARPTTS